MDIEELKKAISDGEGSVPEVKTFLKGIVDEAVAGVQTTNTSLKEEKQKLQTILESMPSAEDIKRFKNIEKQIESSEDAKLIAEGKVDEVINLRTERLRTDYESRLEATATEVNNLKEVNSKLNSSYDNFRIENQIRKDATDAGASPTAIDDMVSRAQRVFKYEEGKIVARDADGELINTDGKLMSTKDYITSLKESAPHFWPASKGGDLGGNGEVNADALVAAADKSTGDFIAKRRKQIADRNKT